MKTLDKTPSTAPPHTNPFPPLTVFRTFSKMRPQVTKNVSQVKLSGGDPVRVLKMSLVRPLQLNKPIYQFTQLIYCVIAKVTKIAELLDRKILESLLRV